MASLKVGKTIAVVGKVYRDKFDGEVVCNPHSIWSAKRILRTDNAEEKRVELHLHTTMSTMDALIRPDELIKTAKRWGHKAIAVTDHGNVQAFPEIAKVAKKEYPELKILYGMEAYYVDDTARALYGEKIPSFDGIFCFLFFVFFGFFCTNIFAIFIQIFWYINLLIIYGCGNIGIFCFCFI
jgi:DNA polymerase-3 subunit alpha (Gram-positive type)